MAGGIIVKQNIVVHGGSEQIFGQVYLVGTSLSQRIYLHRIRTDAFPS